MRKTLLCSFSMLVLSPVDPGPLLIKKERITRNMETRNRPVPGLLTVYAQPRDWPLNAIANNWKVGFDRPKPSRKKKKVIRKKNLYITYPGKDKFSRDGSQLKIPK